MTTLIISLLMLTGFTQQPTPRDSVSLQYCYRQAAQNYPTAKNIELQKKITDLNVAIANTGYYPQVKVRGEARYQSEATVVSLPGGQGPPAPDQDQYEAAVDVTQTIFNAGAVRKQKALESARGEQAIDAIEVKLHQIRGQVDQVYYGILLSRQEAGTIQLLIKNLKQQLRTVSSGVHNGAMLPSQKYILEAELENARKDSATIRSNIEAGYQVLSEIIGDKITMGTDLKLPEVAVDFRSLQPQRPKLDQFESRRQILEQQQELSETGKWPRLSAFGTAAYGRPGLNFLSQEFHDYYIVGLRLQWNFWDFFNANREQQALNIRQKQVAQERRAFDRQLRASLTRIGERIASIRENIKRDQKIVKLRQQIVEETASQLKYGVITATEYVTELTRANRARLTLYINRVRLAQAQTDYMTMLGQPITKYN